ncbi:MAG: efflux RND transporter permease subunit [Bacteroidales bacterium]|nr:efflux RND transporter permease subunit [Bacteroidales bacterium]
MDFIIKRKTLISMLFIGLTLLGYVSYSRLQVELYPNAQLPTLIIQVSTTIQVDPSYIETHAIIPVEGAAGTLEDVEKIESNVTSRGGTVIIYYTQKADLKYAYLKLQEKVNLLSGTLPEEFMLNIIRVDMEQINTMFMDLQVRGTGGVDRVRNIADKDIKRALENIDGIAGIEIYGGRESSIEVRLDEEACRAHNITLNRVRSAISSNSSDKVFVGKVYDADRELFVNISAENRDVTDIGNIIINEEGPIRLKDVATIYFGVKEETSYSRVNGLDAVTISLVYDNQANLIDLSHETIDVVRELNDLLASTGIEIVVQNNNAEIMEKNIDQIINLALIGGLLAVVILWFFLRNLRLVFIIAFSIPVSVYSAFNFFYAAGITINSLTLVGMALAIGMLIDNSVVVLENIYRLAGTGKSPGEAVRQGTKEVWRSVLAATLTTITVFLPFVFSDNFMVKLIGKNIGVSIVSTLLVSLAVALLLIPMATHYLLEQRGGGRSQVFKKLSLHNKLIQSYLIILKGSMRKPASVIIGSLTLFFVALIIGLGLSMNSLSEIETASFRINVVMPGGSTLEKTDAVVADIEKRLELVTEKEDIICRIEEDQATVTVNLKEEWDKESDRNLAEIKNDIFEKIRYIESAEVSLDETSSAGGMGGGTGSTGVNPGSDFTRMLGIGSESESIEIKGQDFNRMRSVAEDLEYYIDELQTIRSVRVNIQDNTPEVQLFFDTELMGRNNITLANIAQELSSFQREYSSGVSFRQGTDLYDIIIKYDTPPDVEEEDKTIDDLKQLQVTSAAGNVMEMEELADIVFATGMGNIHRENQEKSITVTYSFTDEITGSKPLLESAREEIDMLVSGMMLPPGVAVKVIHETNELRDFYILIAIAFLLIYMILAAVFESMATPVVLMFSIPLAALGSLLALILTGNSLLNANTLTGFLILLGVVVNNGIILIDYSNILRKRGYRRSRALMTAGLARVRPIMITAITTIVALLPLAMGKSEYVSTIGASFAITVVGGLALSTLLTLVFIPTFYTGLETSLKWIRDQRWSVKLIMAAAFMVLSLLIWFYMHSFLWQLIVLIIGIILIPAITWFILNSLRKAHETVIPRDQGINIVIRSLVKIYDRDPKLQREWKAAKNIRLKSGTEKEPERVRDMEQMIWQLPLFGFLIWFTYFYIEKGVWIFIFSLLSWLSLMGLWTQMRKVLKKTYRLKIQQKAITVTDRIITWIIPLGNLFIWQSKWDSIAAVAVMGTLWYAGIVIYTTSLFLTSESTDIYRLKGKFRNLRKTFFKIVMATPLIGRTRKPFKALNSVSMEIGNGMFGLLGPNGAGKTTLMRVICGILEQSYGKIWINGLDVEEKREELQGLIGYLPQEFGMYENMSAREYLDYQAILKGITETTLRNERVNYVLGAVHMTEKADDKIGSFSGGMKQRIGIAQILLHLPRILVVDEPTAGLDPRERIRFRNLLVELSRERVVIFSTHIIEDISSSCNKVAVLDRGYLKYLGHPSLMTETARGHVWQFTVPAAEFRSAAAGKMIVQHMSEGGMIKARCISGEKPHPQAVELEPNLEDAYLWLLGRIKIENYDEKETKPSE